MQLAPLCSLVLALALAAGPAFAAETAQPVFQQPLPNVSGKSMSAVRVDYAPGAKSAPHRHGQAFVFAYVLSGEIRSQVEGSPAKVYRAGESWYETPGAHHIVSENASATAPASLLAVFVADTGAALKTD